MVIWEDGKAMPLVTIRPYDRDAVHSIVSNEGECLIIVDNVETQD